MFSSIEYFSFRRKIIYCVIGFLAVMAFVFKYFLIGGGLLAGLYASIQWAIANEGADLPLGLSVLILITGIVGLGISYFIAEKNGVSTFELSGVLQLGKFTRGLPTLSVITIVGGFLLISFNFLEKLE